MDDATLLSGFESATLAPTSFGHREHVRVAWLLLRDAPFESAALRFCTGLRRFAAALGKADRYHETITWAYLAIVNERLRAGAPAAAACSCIGTDFDAFASANADLFDQKNGALAGYYDAPTLASPLARHAFLLPRASRVAGA